MKNTCSLCNNDFILTSNELVVAEEGDMYRLGVECLSCTKETRDACNNILKTLPKKEKKEEPDIERFKERFDTNININNKKKNGKHIHNKSK